MHMHEINVNTGVVIKKFYRFLNCAIYRYYDAF